MSEYKVRRGFSEYNIEVLKEYGLTPEEARDEVVERLKECNLNAADLAKFNRPIDELAFSDVQLIMLLPCGYKDDPKKFCEVAGKDWSTHSMFMDFCRYLDS